jgi:hypothetical protein
MTNAQKVHKLDHGLVVCMEPDEDQQGKWLKESLLGLYQRAQDRFWHTSLYVRQNAAPSPKMSPDVTQPTFFDEIVADARGAVPSLDPYADPLPEWIVKDFVLPVMTEGPSNKSDLVLLLENDGRVTRTKGLLENSQHASYKDRIKLCVFCRWPKPEPDGTPGKKQGTYRNKLDEIYRVFRTH